MQRLIVVLIVGRQLTVPTNVSVAVAVAVVAWCSLSHRSGVDTRRLDGFATRRLGFKRSRQTANVITIAIAIATVIAVDFHVNIDQDAQI